MKCDVEGVDVSVQLFTPCFPQANSSFHLTALVLVIYLYLFIF